MYREFLAIYGRWSFVGRGFRTCGTLDFESALKLVSVRAQAMQKACELKPGSRTDVSEAYRSEWADGTSLEPVRLLQMIQGL